MKMILVPVDFTGLSRNAEDYAVSLANVLGVKIHLLYVWREIMPAAVGPEPWTPVVSESRVEYEKLINKEVAFLKTKCSLNVSGEVETGTKAKTIADVARRTESGLIVMGMNNTRRNRILGETVLNSIRKTKVPVLIVPEEAKFTSIKNILLAVDFREMLESSCFDTLFAIYKKFDSLMTVLHVENPGADVKASEVPEKLQLGLALSRFNYQYEKAESYEVEEAVQNYIDRHPTDLLVLIAHHHTIYERIFETIHTKALGFKMKRPMLVIRHQ